MRLLKLSAVLLTLKVVSCTACAAHDDAEGRYAYVWNQLHEQAPGRGFAGEWYLVSLSMEALAAKNLGGHDADLAWLTERALKEDVRRFDARRWGTDPLETLGTDEGHVGYLGHLGLLLAVECSPKRAGVRRDVLSALERRFAKARNGLVETYPDQIWIPDNAAALAAVALGAKCDHRDVPAAQWLAKWPRDPKTGLLQFVPGSGPRASGNGFNSVYLAYVDAAVAKQQFEAAQRTFGFSLPGLAAWREYPTGVKGKGDIDSGPLIFGLSPSGTGFGLAGASLHDGPRASMLRTAEAAGFTVPWGGPHYLLSPLVGEASVLAARTMPRS